MYNNTLIIEKQLSKQLIQHVTMLLFLRVCVYVCVYQCVHKKDLEGQISVLTAIVSGY